MVKWNGLDQAAFTLSHGAVLLRTVNEQQGSDWPTAIITLLQQNRWFSLSEWYRNGGKDWLYTAPSIAYEEISYVALYRNPPKIWGVGANYRDKAEEMSVVPDGEPICFLKPATTLIGPMEKISLPKDSSLVTAEAEIGIVIGSRCKDVQEEEAWKVIAGFTPTLDMTAQDIHARNPRFLNRAKSYDTFFSFGPQLITLDECPTNEQWGLETVHNGKVAYSTNVTAMIYSIPFIIAFFSKIMTLEPGDIIMTGTPGSVPITSSDEVECRISGFSSLKNVVG